MLVGKGKFHLRNYNSPGGVGTLFVCVVQSEDPAACDRKVQQARECASEDFGRQERKAKILFETRRDQGVSDQEQQSTGSIESKQPPPARVGCQPAPSPALMPEKSKIALLVLERLQVSQDGFGIGAGHVESRHGRTRGRAGPCDAGGHQSDELVFGVGRAAGQPWRNHRPVGYWISGADLKRSAFQPIAAVAFARLVIRRMAARAHGNGLHDVLASLDGAGVSRHFGVRLRIRCFKADHGKHQKRSRQGDSSERCHI